jgi:hypothetical protein
MKEGEPACIKCPITNTCHDDFIPLDENGHRTSKFSPCSGWACGDAIFDAGVIMFQPDQYHWHPIHAVGYDKSRINTEAVNFHSREKDFLVTRSGKILVEQRGVIFWNGQTTR